jgi:hypothetical protein
MLQAQASTLVGTAKDKVVEKVGEKLPGGSTDPYGPGPVPATPTNGAAPSTYGG